MEQCGFLFNDAVLQEENASENLEKEVNVWLVLWPGEHLEDAMHLTSHFQCVSTDTLMDDVYPRAPCKEDTHRIKWRLQT